MKYTLPRIFINGIASICIAAVNTLQQLHVTRINFNNYTVSVLIGIIALKTKTLIVMLLIVINKLYLFYKYNM